MRHQPGRVGTQYRASFRILPSSSIVSIITYSSTKGRKAGEWRNERERGGGGGYSVAACLIQAAIDQAYLSRQTTVPHGNTSNISRLTTFFPYITFSSFAYLASFLFGRRWPPSGHHLIR